MQAVINKKYKVTKGPYHGFEGKCINYRPEEEFEVILQNENWVTKALKADEVEIIREELTEQKN